MVRGALVDGRTNECPTIRLKAESWRLSAECRPTASAAPSLSAPGTFPCDACNWSRKPRPTGRGEFGSGICWRRSSPAAACVRDLERDEACPLRLEWRDVHDDPASRIGGRAHADGQHIARNLEVLDRPRQRKRIRRDDRDIAFTVTNERASKWFGSTIVRLTLLRI
jgi:hypothetical protein